MVDTGDSNADLSWMYFNTPGTANDRWNGHNCNVLCSYLVPTSFNIGDDMRSHNLTVHLSTGNSDADLSGMSFSTTDRYHDRSSGGNCATIRDGGWIYINCEQYIINTGNSDADLSGMSFSTTDRYHDRSSGGNCAAIRDGGWIYINCEQYIMTTGNSDTDLSGMSFTNTDRDND
ncbi:uncharacterized protein LOC134269395 [Saccostrea cucullata]|uniref:uncharacterized protein LOC134269395 n=1 Tax=Saccostrea cuccullata TaxID=36930 RepID=UPI002ED4EE4A